MINVHVICCSPNQNSVSRVVTRNLVDTLSTSANVSTTDLIDLPPSWVTKEKIDGMPSQWKNLYQAVQEADAVAFVTPVYCYSAGSPMVAITEIIGDVIAWKPALILTAAGSLRSHTAISGVISNMMFEQSTLVLPATVQATQADIDNGELVPAIQERIGAISSDFIEYSQRLKGFKP